MKDEASRNKHLIIHSFMLLAWIAITDEFILRELCFAIFICIWISTASMKKLLCHNHIKNQESRIKNQESRMPSTLRPRANVFTRIPARMHQWRMMGAYEKKKVGAMLEMCCHFYFKIQPRAQSAVRPTTHPSLHPTPHPKPGHASYFNSCIPLSVPSPICFFYIEGAQQRPKVQQLKWHCG